LDKNNKYNHKNAEAIINTKKSEMKPNPKIFKLSKKENLLCVIG
jgi:hypothetical protein